jgi:hypothetical protein
MVDTGLVNTGSSPLMKAMWRVARPFMISPEKGAQTSIYLASSPDVEGISGKYFKNRKPTRASGRSQSRPEAARLWRLSQEETGVE